MTGQRQRTHIPKALRSNQETPLHTFATYDELFGPFDMDPACTADQITALTILARGGSILTDPNIAPPTFPSGTLARVGVDGLASPWRGKVWLNPPFDSLPVWIPKAVSEVECGNAELVCALIPVRPDTKVWQEFIARSIRKITLDDEGEDWWMDHHPLLHDLIFLDKRLRFIGEESTVTFSCCIVVWSKGSPLLGESD